MKANELERLEVLRQELREEIGSICSEIEEWGWQGELTTNECRLFRQFKFCDWLHCEIIRERRLIKENQSK